MFEEVGFKDARVADIAKRAKTSYGSFYFYFDSKEAIFRDVVTEYTGHMFQVSRSNADIGTDPAGRIEEATRAYLKAYAQNARLMAVIEEVSPYQGYFRDLMLEIRSLFVQRNASGIRRLQAQGLADQELDPELAASALGGMVERMAQVWFLMGEPYDEAAVIATLTRLWANGIGLSRRSGPAPGVEGRRRAGRAVTTS